MNLRGHGPLTPGELAEGAVLGDVALVLSFAGWVLPVPLVFFVAATVPFAALAARRRLRAVVVSAVAISPRTAGVHTADAAGRGWRGTGARRIAAISWPVSCLEL